MYTLNQSCLALNMSTKPFSMQALDITRTVKPVFIHPSGNALDFANTALGFYRVNQTDNRDLRGFRGHVSVIKKGQSQ